MTEVPREGPDPLILENLVGGVGICTSGEVIAIGEKKCIFSQKQNRTIRRLLGKLYGQ